MRKEDKREEMIIKHVPLVKYIAQKYFPRVRGVLELEDLINIGIIGLIDAIEKFDPKKGVKFSTYAELRIKGAILDEIRSQDLVSRSTREKIGAIERAYSELEAELGRSAEDEEVAEKLGIDLSEFYKLLDESRNISLISLDDPIVKTTEMREYVEKLKEGLEIGPFEYTSLKEIKEILKDSIEELPEKEKLVVTLYYLEDLTMKEIGEIIGVSESRVSQIHTKAILKLRAKMKRIVENKDR